MTSPAVRGAPLALALALVLGAGACGTGAGGVVHADEMRDTTTVVTLAESGGIQGGRRVLTVRRDGVAQLADERRPGTPPRRWSVAPSQIGSLEALIASPDFARLDSIYLPDNPCCDRLEYELTARTGGGTIHTRTVDGAQQPSALRLTLELLQQIRSGAPAP